MLTILATPLFERMLGADHRRTPSSRNKLAMDYLATGQAAVAIPLYERTLVDCQRTLGADHPNTLTLRDNLAMAYRATRRTAEGDPAAQDITEVRGPSGG